MLHLTAYHAMGKRRQPSSSVADQKGLEADSNSAGSDSDDTLSSDDPSQTSEPEGHVESEDALAQVQQGIGVSDGRCMEEKQSMTATTRQQTDIDQAGQEGSADADSKADEVSRELHMQNSPVGCS